MAACRGQVGQRDLAYLCPQCDKRCLHLVHSAHHGRIAAFAVPVWIHAHHQPAHIRLVGRSCHGLRPTGWILRVVPGDQGVEQCHVARASGDRTDMVETCRQFECPMSAHPAPAGLQSGQAVGRARETDRAACVRPQRGKCEPRRHPHARSTGGSAGPQRVAPGVHRRGDGRVMDGKGPLGHLRLGKVDRAGFAQSAHHGSVASGAKIAVDRHARSRGQVRSMEQVLHCDRHTFQHAALPVGEHPVRPPRLPHCAFAVDAGEGVKPALQRVHPRQNVLHQFRSGQRARRQQRGNFDQLAIVQRRLGHGGQRLPPTMNDSIVVGFSVRLRHAWRVPFWITTSPAFKWRTSPSSSSSQSSPSTITS